jgi:hypothetical protein
MRFAVTGKSQPSWLQVPFQVTRFGGATASVIWPAAHDPRTFTPDGTALAPGFGIPITGRSVHD